MKNLLQSGKILLYYIKEFLFCVCFIAFKIEARNSSVSLSWLAKAAGRNGKGNFAETGILGGIIGWVCGKYPYNCRVYAECYRFFFLVENDKADAFCIGFSFSPHIKL